MRNGPLIIVLGVMSFLTLAAQVSSAPKATAKFNNLIRDGNVGRADK
jgi:hypothetical protein